MDITVISLFKKKIPIKFFRRYANTVSFVSIEKKQKSMENTVAKDIQMKRFNNKDIEIGNWTSPFLILSRSIDVQTNKDGTGTTTATTKMKWQFEKENVDQTVKLICSCNKKGITFY